MSEMDRLAELFENRLEKIAMLNDFISIFGQRAELLSQLRETNTQNDENRELLIQCRLRLQQFRTSVLPRARVELARMDRLQGCMLNMIEELDNREAESVDTAVPNKTMQFLTVSAAGNKENHNPQTPNSVRPETRLLLSDYKNSPFAARMKPAALQFVDFEATLTPEDFARIPQYMRGRETLAELRQFFDTVIVRCFTDKYTLLHKKRECVRHPQQLTLWKHYRQQAEYFPQRMFITQGDIATQTGRMMDKKTANRIAMLRHLQLVQEHRHQTTVCYLWLGRP